MASSSGSTVPPPPPAEALANVRSFFAGIVENCSECIAYYCWKATSSNQLSLMFGDVVLIIERTNNDWWYGDLNGKKGYFPTNYVRARYDQFIDEEILHKRILMNKNVKDYKTEIAKEQNEFNSNSEQDNEYFEGYNTVKIHLEMISDDARTKAYRNAILSFSPLMKNKIVLDVGCGTGILSLFCAKAGAKHVYAVEASDYANKTRKIVKDNNMDGCISVLKGKIEDIFLPVENVDIIISEWMGTMLVCESMIFSVLYARDKYLKKPFAVGKISKGKGKGKGNRKGKKGKRKKKGKNGINETEEKENKNDENDENDENNDQDDDEDDDEIIVMSNENDVNDVNDVNDENEDGYDDEQEENDKDKDDKDDKPSPPPVSSDILYERKEYKCNSGLEEEEEEKERERGGGGLLMPSHCSLLIAPIDIEKDWYSKKVSLWNDIYGFNMSELMNESKDVYLGRATYEINISNKHLLSDSQSIMTFDMYNITENEFDFYKHSFEFIINKDGLFCGFTGWFDVIFCPNNSKIQQNSKKNTHINDMTSNLNNLFNTNVTTTSNTNQEDNDDNDDDNDDIDDSMDANNNINNSINSIDSINISKILLSTSPDSKRTHWNQTTFLVNNPINVKKGDKLSGNLIFFRNNYRKRHFRLRIECQINKTMFRKMFFLWD